MRGGWKPASDIKPGIFYFFIFLPVPFPLERKDLGKRKRYILFFNQFSLPGKISNFPGIRFLPVPLPVFEWWAELKVSKVSKELEDKLHVNVNA
jgi:hypothetical protein